MHQKSRVLDHILKVSVQILTRVFCRTSTTKVSILCFSHWEYKKTFKKHCNSKISQCSSQFWYTPSNSQANEAFQTVIIKKLVPC